jgi:SMODS-associated and fused to various effectors sensor domain
VTTEVYQRHRTSGAWTWPDEAHLAFRHTVAVGEAPESAEGVLLLNVTGSVNPNEIPAPLQGLPWFVLEPEGAVPAPDLLTSRAGLRSFEQEVRTLFAEIEASARSIRRLHVFAALPMAAAVALGRAHDPHIRPALAVYDRDDASGSYSYALEIA